MKIELHHGDCLKKMQDIPEQSVDLILTDPPYGTTACKWDAVIAFVPMWEAVKRVLKINGVAVFTAAQPFSSALGASNLPWLRYSWIWRKSAATGHLNAKKMPMSDFEDVLVFYASQPTYNPQGLVPHNKITRRGGNGGCYGDSGKENMQEWTNYPRRVLEISSEGMTVHPTQKPIALMEYLIRTYTNEDEVVLDFTMGSGTTGVACVNTNRNFIGIEKEEMYFKIAKKRIDEAKYKMGLFIGNDKNCA